jgi:hypothetical protein
MQNQAVFIAEILKDRIKDAWPGPGSLRARRVREIPAGIFAAGKSQNKIGGT